MDIFEQCIITGLIMFFRYNVVFEHFADMPWSGHVDPCDPPSAMATQGGFMEFKWRGKI
jgi:hypothetical protein